MEYNFLEGYEEVISGTEGEIDNLIAENRIFIDRYESTIENNDNTVTAVMNRIRRRIGNKYE